MILILINFYNNLYKILKNILKKIKNIKDYLKYF
jgi:hypothetical protein